MAWHRCSFFAMSSATEENFELFAVADLALDKGLVLFGDMGHGCTAA